jgi:hypothetical protein
MVPQMRCQLRGTEPWRPLSVIDEMERMMDDALRRPCMLLGRYPIWETVSVPAIEMYERDYWF